MEIRVAQRLSNIPPYPFASIARRVKELETQGHDVVRLDMGSPDMPPPEAVVKALHNSTMKPDRHGYGGFNGIAALRKAFSGYYQRRFEVDLDPDREILPLIGSKEGIVNISLALVNPGDVVLTPDPGYTAYAMGARLADAEPYPARLDPENNYLPDLESIPQNILNRARLLWINYPNNPTGAVASVDDLEKIVDFCKTHNLMLASDNPYADVIFEDVKPPSIFEVPGARDIAVEFNSLSKLYNMAGWRVGVCVGNETMVAALGITKSNIDSGLFLSIQEAAVVALESTSTEWLAKRNAEYKRRRDIILEAVPSIGLDAISPKAGLYVWAQVKSGDDLGYVKLALESAFVSMAPGVIYGDTSSGYVRMSLIVPAAKMQEAMNRLKMLKF